MSRSASVRFSEAAAARASSVQEPRATPFHTQCFHTLHCVGLAGVAVPAAAVLTLGPLGFEASDSQQAALNRACPVADGPPLVFQWLMARPPRQAFPDAVDPWLCSTVHALHFLRAKAAFLCIAALALVTTARSKLLKADIRRVLLFWILAGTAGCANSWFARFATGSWMQDRFASQSCLGQASFVMIAAGLLLYLRLRGQSASTQVTTEDTGFALHISEFFSQCWDAGASSTSGAGAAESARAPSVRASWTASSQPRAQIEQQFMDSLQAAHVKREAELRQTMAEQSRAEPKRNRMEWTAMMNSSIR